MSVLVWKVSFFTGLVTACPPNSKSIWRNTGMDVFSRSFMEEGDGEALKWAALEKLPRF